MLTLRFDTHPNGTIHLGNISSDDIIDGKFSIDADEYQDILTKAHELIRTDLSWSKDSSPYRHFHLETMEGDKVVKTIDVMVALNRRMHKSL